MLVGMRALRSVGKSDGLMAAARLERAQAGRRTASKLFRLAFAVLRTPGSMRAASQRLGTADGFAKHESVRKVRQSENESRSFSCAWRVEDRCVPV